MITPKKLGESIIKNNYISLDDIPLEIMEAATKIDLYFQKQNIKDWQLMNICSRTYAKKYAIMITNWGNKNLPKSASPDHPWHK